MPSVNSYGCMTTVHNDFLARKNEVENCLTSIRLYESRHFGVLQSADEEASDPMSLDVALWHISTKASMLLMLYNIVESSVTTCLSRIHSYIRSKNVKYCDFSSEMKILIITYYRYLFEKSNDVPGSSPQMVKMIDFINNQAYFDIDYDIFCSSYHLYSGNLDCKMIRDIFSKYGIEITDHISELQSIKTKRNSLAHGEESFEEVGRNISSQQLQVYATKTFEVMEHMIDAVKSFLENEEYKVH